MRRIGTFVAGISIAVFLWSPTNDAFAAPSSTGASQGQGIIGTLLSLLGFSSPFGEPGQPNQSCEDTPNPPGNAGSSSNTGSPFSPDGKAGTVYAGEQPQNSNNPKSASQYDAACARPTH
jgi:hypothetical protein